MPCPMQDPIVQTEEEVEEGRFESVTYIISGQHLKSINLAFNKFGEKFKKPLQNFLLNTHEDF